MKLSEIGYTPTNYKALVELTNLSNAEFCRQFSIPEQTFYKHLAGSRTMKWQDWQLLYDAVASFKKITIISTHTQ